MAVQGRIAIESINASTKEQVNNNTLAILLKRFVDIEEAANKKMSESEFEKFTEANYLERRFLLQRINSLLTEDVILDEESFRYLWQSGKFDDLDICATAEGYIKFVRKYLELYGKPLKKDTTIYRVIQPDEDEENLIGCSWTKDFKSALNFAAKHRRNEIFSMVLPKGTKTIHLHPTHRFAESEDIVDISTAKNETVQRYATLKKINYQTDYTIATFEKADGAPYFYRLNGLDSKLSLMRWIEETMQAS